MNNKTESTFQQNSKALKSPTIQQNKIYQDLYDFFNSELFENKLPNVILNFSRMRGSKGFFINSKIWKNQKNQKKTLAEINLNPIFLIQGNIKDVCSTLVHEMVHLWQFYFGKFGKHGYHNKEFSKKMESVGLITSSTGEEGGERLGKKMTHYILKDGLFFESYKKIKKNKKFPWLMNLDKIKLGKTKKAKVDLKTNIKQTYFCPTCDIRVWGKRGLAIICSNCNIRFREQ